MIGLGDFTGGVVWDTEARARKEEEVGWDLYKSFCGVSIAVVAPLSGQVAEGLGFYSDSDEPPYDLHALSKRLQEAPIVVSFNGITWDRQVLVSATGVPCPDWNELDLYRIIRKVVGTGWPEGTWKLNSIAERTLRRTKTLDGAMAPTLAAQGRMGELVKYCLTDVMLTRRLAWHMADNGYVVGPGGRIFDISDVMEHELRRIRGARPATPFIGA